MSCHVVSCHPPVLCGRYPREAVWAANLTLVAQLVKVWGQVLVVDKMPLLKMLTQGDQRSASYLSAADRNVATALCSFAAFEVCAAATSSLSRPVELPLSAPYSVLEISFFYPSVHSAFASHLLTWLSQRHVSCTLASLCIPCVDSQKGTMKTLDPLRDHGIPPDKFFGMFAKGLLVKPKLLYTM